MASPAQPAETPIGRPADATDATANEIHPKRKRTRSHHRAQQPNANQPSPTNSTQLISSQQPTIDQSNRINPIKRPDQAGGNLQIKH